MRVIGFFCFILCAVEYKDIVYFSLRSCVTSSIAALANAAGYQREVIRPMSPTSQCSDVPVDNVKQLTISGTNSPFPNDGSVKESTDGCGTLLSSSCSTGRLSNIFDPTWISETSRLDTSRLQ